MSIHVITHHTDHISLEGCAAAGIGGDVQYLKMAANWTRHITTPFWGRRKGVLNLGAYAAVLPLVASLDLLLGAFTLVYLGARALTLGMRARGAAWIVTGATT